MTEPIKIGRMARDFAVGGALQVEKASDDVTRLSFPASSEAPVERWFGKEVLGHTAKAVRMNRLNGQAAPLLFNHNWDDPVGVIDGARVSDGRLHVDAHLFDTARAREVGAMVAGGLRNVSVGYEIRALREDKNNTFTATDWEPLEVSLVTVPADASVGLGRQTDNEPRPVPVTRAEDFPTAAEAAAYHKESNVDDSKKAAAGVNAETTERSAPRVQVVEDHGDSMSATELESTRKKAIINLAKATQCDDRFVQRWIRNGISVERAAEEMAQIQQERAKDSNAATFLDMSPTEVKRYSLMRALRASLNKNWAPAGLELEANKEISKRMNRLPRSETAFFVPLDVMMSQRSSKRYMTRDMSAAGDSNLVSTANMPGSFIDLLRNTSVTLRMGVRRMAGLVGNVTIPKMTSGNTAYWLADENTAITESQPVIGQLSLSPKNVAALTELSHQLMQQSTPDAEQLVLDSIARDIALAVDIGVLRGSGSAGQPQGIVGTSGVGSFTGTALAAPGILEAQSDVAAANALNPGCGYVTTPAVAALLMDRPELSTTGVTPLWTGNMMAGTLKGFPAMSSNQMLAATALFGWWDAVVLAEWGVLELMTNPYSDFTRGLSAVRGWYTCDVGVRYPAAFSYATTIT